MRIHLLLNKKFQSLSNETKLRIFKFLFVGILINFFVACIYLSLIFFNFGSISSLTISYIFGVLSSIYINKNFTFNVKKPSLKIWYNFILIHIFCYVLSQVSNETFLFILKDYKFKYLVSLFITIGLAATVNFVCMNMVIKRFNKENISD